MFYYLDGTVTIIAQNLAVIDVGGVGYACFSTANTLARLELGKKARLYIFNNVKEDAFDLYGFYDLSEKRCFEQLLGVSGVGPKAALSMLSSCSAESLAIAILNEDEAVLTMAPGVGKKLAQRVILELRDKVSKDMPSLKASGVTLPTAASGGVDSGSVNAAAVAVNNAAAALAVLGFSQAEISAALRSIDTAGLSTEEIIRLVLQG